MIFHNQFSQAKANITIGFFGCGNLAQVIMRALVERKVLNADQIFASNRTEGKLLKVKDQFGVQTCSTNEMLIEKSKIVVLAMKPQDLLTAVEPLVSLFDEGQIVISLAAGITLDALEKLLPQCQIVRLMPNTPSTISRGVLGYCMSDSSIISDSLIEGLFSALGYVLRVQDEDQLEALTVSCASGTGFVFELMLYWQDWLEEHGFDTATARRMTVETFAGASMLAAEQPNSPIEDLLAKVTSKKGVTQAGLESMRELEIERNLRISFEKAAMRNQELSQQSRKPLLS